MTDFIADQCGNVEDVRNGKHPGTDKAAGTGAGFGSKDVRHGRHSGTDKTAGTGAGFGSKGALDVVKSLFTWIVLAFGILFAAIGAFDERERSPWLVLGGIAMVVGAWFLARAERGSARFNGMGTAFFGETKTPRGKIKTKWISLFFLPVLPVRSCLILDEWSSESSGALQFESVTQCLMVPLSGLGLSWSSIRMTLLWSLPTAAIIALLVAIFAIKMSDLRQMAAPSSRAAMVPSSRSAR